MNLTGNITRFLESNTDTDVIIPARFLKRTALDGFEQFAFFEKKYDASTVCEPTIEAKDYVFDSVSHNPACPLNHPNCKDATFLLTWENFGCGSSREHAVYALRNFKVIIGSAPEGKSAFADIFRDNCRQNLIWTPVISPEDHTRLKEVLETELENSSVDMVLDVAASTLATKSGSFSCSFDLPEHHRNYLLAGLDAFEKARQEISSHLHKIEDWEGGNAPVLSSSPNASR
jgi:3-isopropylmalate/(R)-2-methylmalate dehydratase small subunit